MKSIDIPLEQMSPLRQKQARSGSDAVSRSTRFADLPLPSRLLLAVPRVRGTSVKASLTARYVLDTLGRIIDPTPARAPTIEAVNQLAEVLLTPCQFDDPVDSQGDGQFLTARENLVLCVLCQLRAGQHEQASRLTRHWLTSTSVDGFNAAANALCKTSCFKDGGAQVFTPSCSAPVIADNTLLHEKITNTDELTLGESLLLNAVRLRMRTLSYRGINVNVLPLLREQVGLPRIESLIDAHLMEALQYSTRELDVRCFCSSDISADEARLLASFAAFGSTDTKGVNTALCDWLPADSATRLLARSEEFQHIVQKLGAVIPRREWHFAELEVRTSGAVRCRHHAESAMLH